MGPFTQYSCCVGSVTLVTLVISYTCHNVLMRSVIMASVIMASVIMANVFMAKVLWQM